jgi:hypothetical protein
MKTGARLAIIASEPLFDLTTSDSRCTVIFLICTFRMQISEVMIIAVSADPLRPLVTTEVVEVGAAGVHAKGEKTAGGQPI